MPPRVGETFLPPPSEVLDAIQTEESTMRACFARCLGRRSASHPTVKLHVRMAGVTAVLIAIAAGGPIAANAEPLTFTNYTTANGLGSNRVNGVYAQGSRVYASTYNSVSISTDGGATYTSYGEGDLFNVLSVHAIGDTVYGGTYTQGIGISTDGGSSWTFATTANGLGGNDVTSITSSGGTLYATTDASSSGLGGLSISRDGGTSWTNLSSANGAPFVDSVRAVKVVADKVYVGSYGHVHTSPDGGATWSTFGPADGLPSAFIYGLDVVGDSIYAAVGTVDGGVSVSRNGGAQWTTYTRADGLNSNSATSISVVDGVIYAGFVYNAIVDVGGVNISFDDGTSWTASTAADGLGANAVYDIYVDNGKIYAATIGGLSIANLPSAVPEIDPAGVGSVVALVMACAGLVERQRTVAAPSRARGRRPG